MRALCLTLALFCGGSAFAGGAIGGSTGSKCLEYISLRPMEFQRLVQQAMSERELVYRGEVMELESVDWDEQVIQMRSVAHRERSIIWYVVIYDEDDGY